MCIVFSIQSSLFLLPFLFLFFSLSSHIPSTISSSITLFVHSLLPFPLLLHLFLLLQFYFFSLYSYFILLLLLSLATFFLSFVFPILIRRKFCSIFTYSAIQKIIPSLIPRFILLDLIAR